MTLGSHQTTVGRSQNHANSGAPPLLAAFGDEAAERLKLSGIPGALVSGWTWRRA
jgi:hypothetical protein